MSEKTKTDGKKGAEAASNIITIRLPASCPLFRYTLNKEFGSTASQSVPAGFQVPPVSAGGAAAPGQSGAGGQSQQAGGGGGGGGGQPAPPSGGDLPTHTSGQPPPPTDTPAPNGQRKRQDPSDPSGQQGQGGQPAGDAGGLPVVREGEQPPPPFGGDQGQTSGGQASAPAGAPAPASTAYSPPGGQPQPSQNGSLQNQPDIPTGAETGWLGITQEAGQNSTTAKQLQGDVGQIQVLPFPSTPFSSYGCWARDVELFLIDSNRVYPPVHGEPVSAHPVRPKTDAIPVEERYGLYAAVWPRMGHDGCDVSYDVLGQLVCVYRGGHHYRGLPAGVRIPPRVLDRLWTW